MEQPVNSQGGAAADPNNAIPPPPSPGTIISPQNMTTAQPAQQPPAPPAPPAPSKQPPAVAPAPQAMPLPKPLPVKAAPVAPAATSPTPAPAPQPAHTDPTPAPAPKHSIAVSASKPIPVVPAPPSVEAVPAALPVKESLLTAPHLDKRAEAKPIVPTSMNLAPSHHKASNPMPNATVLSTKPYKLIPKLPFELWLAIAVVVATALISLIKPLTIDSTNIKHFCLAAAILSLLAAVGMIFKSNWARSIYVSATIAIIIMQGFMIYQLRTTASPTANFVNPNPAGTLRYRWANLEHWLDPKHGQGGERLGLLVGEFIAILLLTTPYMQRVFEMD